MDLELLKFFKITADLGSMTGAAKRLHCVQPNISARIKQLEESLDVKLFYRKPKGVVLTPEGETLLLYTEQLLNLLQEAKYAIEKKKHSKVPLNIGITDIYATIYLPAIISDYYKESPEIPTKSSGPLATPAFRRPTQHY